METSRIRRYSVLLLKAAEKRVTLVVGGSLAWLRVQRWLPLSWKRAFCAYGVRRHPSQAEGQNDLLEIKAYIEEELLNPSAALTTVSRITKSLRILQNHAQAGAPLSSIVDIESDYRFIVSGNYISFYRAYGSEVFIDRILYARRDYMRILFGDSTTDE